MPENTQRQRGGEAHTLSRHVIVKSKISTAKRCILNLFLVVELWPFMCYSEMGLWGLCKGSKVERWPWNRRGGRVDKLWENRAFSFLLWKPSLLILKWFMFSLSTRSCLGLVGWVDALHFYVILRKKRKEFLYHKSVHILCALASLMV